MKLKLADKSPEFYILSFSLFFFLISVLSAYNFILFFILIECISLNTLALFFTSSKNAGSKQSLLSYFIVNAFASVFMLFSITLFYGLFSTFSYKYISSLLLFNFADQSNSYFNLILLLTIFFFISSLFIKLGVIPFHFWLFDIYEKIPHSLMIYLLFSIKLVFFTLIFYFMNILFISFYNFFYTYIILLSLVGLLISLYVSLTQVTTRKFLLCSSLINSNFLLLALLTFSYQGSTIFFLFLLFDTLMFYFLGFFLSLLIKYDSRFFFYSSVTSIYDFFYIKSGLIKIFIAILVFSLSGFPPFGIFILKYQITKNLFSLNSVVLSIVLLIASCINFFYFIRVFKIMFFTYKNEFVASNFKFISCFFDKKINTLIYFFVLLILSFNFFFLIFFDFFLYTMSFIICSIL